MPIHRPASGSRFTPCGKRLTKSRRSGAVRKPAGMGCSDRPSASSDAALDGGGRCIDSCPNGTLCANGWCKEACPVPDSLGISCGPVGSICCSLTEACTGTTATACTNSCTPFVGGCPEGFGCHILNASSAMDYSDCRLAGTGLQGAACTTSAECAADHACISGQPSRCLRYCVVDDAARGCDVGLNCQGIGRIVDGKHYGLCA